MVIDYELRDLQRADSVGEDAEPLHIRYVENDQDIGFLQRFRAEIARIANIVAKQKLVHLRPRRRIHYARADPHLTEQTGERGLRSAPVAVGVDVGGYCDRAPRAELLRETLDRFPSLL